jgi:putative protease
MAIDSYLRDPDAYSYDPRLLRELESVSHREYCTGFYLDKPMEEPQLSTINGYIREKSYFATAIDESEYSLSLPENLVRETKSGKLYFFVQRNKIKIGDSAEIISPSQLGKPFMVSELYDPKGEALESAPHPSQIFIARVPYDVRVGDIIRSGE